MGRQRKEARGPPKLGVLIKTTGMYFNSEYLESFSLARTKEIPPFPQDPSVNEQTHIKLPELVTFKYPLLPTCLFWEVWELMSEFRRESHKVSGQVVAASGNTVKD